MVKEQENLQKDILSSLGGIISGIVVVGVILIILLAFHVISLPSGKNPLISRNTSLSPTPTLTDADMQRKADINTCGIQGKEDIVKSITHLASTITGEFEGKVQNVIITPPGVTFTLVSFDGKVMLPIRIADATFIIYSKTTPRLLPRTSLVSGRTVDVTFNCDLHQSKPYTIISVGVFEN